MPVLSRCVLSAALFALAAAPAAEAALTVEPHTRITHTFSPTAVSAGDVNGDGFDDVAISGCGPAGVVFGAAAPGEVSLEALGGRGFPLDPVATCGPRPVALGDVNGDGKDDLGFESGYGPRSLHVLYGRGAGSEVVDPRSPGSGGFTLVLPDAVFTTSIFPVGDVNGDGLADIGLAGVDDGTLVAGALFSAAGRTGDVPVPVDFDGVRLRTTAPEGLSCCIEFAAIGDADGDSRDDIAVKTRESAPARIVRGRATAGDAVLENSAPADTLSPSLEGVSLGDLNGDGIGDLGGRSIALSSATGELFSPSRAIRLFVGLGRAATLTRGVGDVNGDGRDDLISHAGAVADGWIEKSPTYIFDPNLVFGSAAPQDVDLSTLSSPAFARLSSLWPRQRVVGGVRFSGGKSQLLSEDIDVTVYDVVDRPVPPDTTAPVLSAVNLDRSLIFSKLPLGPRQLSVRYTVSERAWVTLTVTRSGRTVMTGKAHVGLGRDNWRIDSDFWRRASLASGSYKATVSVVDEAGNVGAAKSVTFQVI